MRNPYQKLVLTTAAGVVALVAALLTRSGTHPGAQPAAAPPPVSTGAAVSCDPSYPDFCIPPPPPDLNCDDVQGPKPFHVRPPDPHGFDRDHDGWGCGSRKTGRHRA